MDKIMGFYISHHLVFYITFVSVMHFHNHLGTSISPKILKEIFAKLGHAENTECVLIKAWFGTEQYSA